MDAREIERIYRAFRETSRRESPHAVEETGRMEQKASAPMDEARTLEVEAEEQETEDEEAVESQLESLADLLKLYPTQVHVALHQVFSFATPIQAMRIAAAAKTEFETLGGLKVRVCDGYPVAGGRHVPCLQVALPDGKRVAGKLVFDRDGKPFAIQPMASVDIVTIQSLRSKTSGA